MPGQIKIKPAVSQDEFLGVAGAVDNLEDRVMVLEHALASLLRDIYDEQDAGDGPDPEPEPKRLLHGDRPISYEAIHDGSETVVGDPDDWAAQEAARLRAEAANEVEHDAGWPPQDS